MIIVVSDQVHLSEFRWSDKPALVQHLNDRDIYDRTLRIPYPYTDANTDEWLALAAKITEQQGRQTHWAIRSPEDALIGGCGFSGFQAGKSHLAEVGYWLAKPFWGRGVMALFVGLNGERWQFLGEGGGGDRRLLAGSGEKRLLAGVSHPPALDHRPRRQLVWP